MNKNIRNLALEVNICIENLYIYAINEKQDSLANLSIYSDYSDSGQCFFKI